MPGQSASSEQELVCLSHCWRRDSRQQEHYRTPVYEPTKLDTVCVCVCVCVHVCVLCVTFYWKKNVFCVDWLIWLPCSFLHSPGPYALPREKQQQHSNYGPLQQQVCRYKFREGMGEEIWPAGARVWRTPKLNTSQWPLNLGSLLVNGEYTSAIRHDREQQGW